MNQKKILIAGGSHADIPMIKAAKKINYYVITSGNKSDDLGHPYADEYAPADFSDKEQVLAIAIKHNIDAIISSCNDFSAISCAYVADKLGLPGHDSLENCITIHHKDKFREFCQQHQLLTPLAKNFDSEETAYEYIDDVAFPVIIKPVDLTGGKGISVVKNKDTWKQSIEAAFSISKAKRIVIEEFIEGSRHGFSAIIIDGKVVFYFHDDEYYRANQFLVAGTSFPGSLNEGVIKKIIEFSEKTISILKLVDGLFHIQFILKDETPYVIEICRRPPGDLYPLFVEHATGVNYSSAILNFVVQNKNNFDSKFLSKGFYARHCVMGDKSGTIKKVNYSPIIQKYIIDEFKLWKENTPFNHLTQKVVLLFMKFNTEIEMKEISNNLYNYIEIEYDSL